MPGLFLNKVKTNAQTGLKPPVTGKLRSDVEFLSTYAKIVAVDDEIAMADMARSVPSVYQRPFQFFKALDQQEHPLHAAVQSEWRGLLAAIALEQLLNAPINVSLFQVAKPDSMERSRVGNVESGDLHFRAALYHQLPRRKLKKAADKEQGHPDPGGPKEVSDFESWSMIRCRGKLLGATSPWSLVYTAASYEAPGNIPWRSEDGCLIDPIQHYDPSRKGERLEVKPVQLAMLYAWVSDLLANTNEFGDFTGLTTYKTTLINRLGDWQRALEPYQTKGMHLHATTSRFETAPFKHILTFVQGIGGGDVTKDSDIYVGTKSGGQMLLLSPSLAPQTRIHGGMFVAQVDIAGLPAEGTEFNKRDGMRVQKEFLHAEAFFFPRKLVRLQLATEALCPTLEGQTAPVTTLAVPVRPEFFKYFTLDSLKRWLRVEDRGAGGAIATLRIPVSGGEPVTVRHVYAAGDVVSTSEAPAFAVWPNAYDEGWNANLAGYASSEDRLTVVPVFQHGLSEDPAMEAALPANTTVRLWHCKNRPALGFALSVLGEGVAQEPAEAAGLVLRGELRAPEQDIHPNRRWRVGVDFGTSSTTVLFDDGQGPKPLRFQGGLLAFTANENGNLDLEKHMYPRIPFSPPFGTLLYESQPKQYGDLAERSPYFIRFVLPYKENPFQKLVRNLKWDANGNGEQGFAALKAYLRELVRYIVWEARSRGVGNIEFLWSYPTSLPDRALTALKNFWLLLRDEGFHKDIAVQDQTRYLSESVAACLAMKKAGVVNLQTEALTIGVDIGGGSTDISFWSKNGTLKQVSFKIAGNDFLRGGLLNEEVLEQVLAIWQPDVLKSSAEAQAEALSVIAEKPEIYVAGALSKAGEGSRPGEHPFTRHIALNSHRAPWMHLRSLVYLYATGLAYYLGSQARVFDVPQSDVTIYFGGRGSMFLRWLTLDNADLRDILTHAFVEGLSRQVPDDDIQNKLAATNLDLRFAGLAFGTPNLPQLKTEVAEGLLDATPDYFAEEMRTSLGKRSVEAGEIHWGLQPKNAPFVPLAWNGGIAEEDLKSLHPPRDFGSTLIDAFRSEMLKDDPKKYVETQSLDPRLKALRLEPNRIVQLIQDSAGEDEKVLQPIFAYELKAMMKQYVETVVRDNP